MFAHVAEDGSVVGFALWFRNYSTWTGRHGVYLEDLYVRPGPGWYGLLLPLARICVENRYAHGWSVLDWNEPSIRFYETLGSRPMDGWTVRRLDGDALIALGSAHG